jgi:hypothetical protein
MLKHVGRHGEQRVAVVFREVPNEEHMCLVIYPGQLQSAYHNDLMKCIESNAGQTASNLGEAMQRYVGADGRNLLVAAHRERWMKKVRCQDVIMTPVPNQRGARLDEINKIIKEVESGADAAKRMALIDAQAGMADPAKTVSDTAYAATTPAGVLSDADIAANIMTQAAQMESQIAGLQAEIARLTEEATALDPSVAPAPDPKKRGRPKKAAA